MLPSIEMLDAYLAASEGVLGRLEHINRTAQLVDELRERVARARCLVLLELYNELGRTGKRGRYSEIAHVTGLSVSRVQQLLSDARLWSREEANGG